MWQEGIRSYAIYISTVNWVGVPGRPYYHRWLSRALTRHYAQRTTQPVTNQVPRNILRQARRLQA
ncbi:hypothetical protein C8T65DRAFT_651293 [Cerioporus squamosus]|nr:hypothetical protein C8T65DRAFT_651293 [Cerioporus squamosus]